MMRKKRYPTATMADGYVKTIGPTAAPFTPYWRMSRISTMAKTEVFWGNAASAKEAARKEALTGQAARRRGWKRCDFEVVELTDG